MKSRFGAGPAVPPWYQWPTGSDASDYVLRLEQQLAVACMYFDFLKGGGLSGEHEIIDGTLQLCVRQPRNPLLRIVLAEIVRHMRQVRPETLPQYQEKIDLLQRSHPLPVDVGEIISGAIKLAVTG